MSGAHTHNPLGQPVGPSLAGWRAPSIPARESLRGRYCTVEPLEAARHAADLHAANSLDRDGRNWTYLPYGPYADAAAYRDWMDTATSGSDPLFFAIVERRSGKAVGVASYMRIDPVNGVIEVGHLNFSPLLQRQRAATEAMFLMMQRVFELGFRRYEWKCDSLNAPSRAAARRLGFSYEGTFRQAAIYKGRSRDTAWFSILDREWPALRQAHLKWLADENFTPEGRQRTSLASLTAPLLAAHA